MLDQTPFCKRYASTLALALIAKSTSDTGLLICTLLIEPTERRIHLAVAKNEMRSARSLSFFKPANTIFVPTMYFFGLTKYSNMCLSDQTIPEFLFASEYAKPSHVPEVRPPC